MQCPVLQCFEEKWLAYTLISRRPVSLKNSSRDRAMVTVRTAGQAAALP